MGYLGFKLPISRGQIRVLEVAQAESGDALSVAAATNCRALLQASQFNMEHFSGMHNWYACSHARPTFCNVCREALPGVTSHGLSCEGRSFSPAEGDSHEEAGHKGRGGPAFPSPVAAPLPSGRLLSSLAVCKFKAHKRCAVRATNSCKWTTLASIGNDIIEDEDGVSLELSWAVDLPASPPTYLPQGREWDVQTEACPFLLQVAMPHQWLEGNLPVGARCAVCDKTSGSVRRLQDWRCLWCKAVVSTAPPFPKLLAFSDPTSASHRCWSRGRAEGGDRA